MEEDDVEDIELGELDLDVMEKECEMAEKGYVSREQVELLQKFIIKSKAFQYLEINIEPPKGIKRKSPEEDLKWGRKTNKQRITKIGVNIIESG